MDETPHSDSLSTDDEGEPVAALALIDEEASGRFWTRLRNKIDRRVATAQVVSFSWNLPKLVLLEFLEIAFNIFSPAKDRKGDSQ
jgi:hypothetical protein